MDFMTLATALLLSFGLLTADVAFHSSSVSIEVGAPETINKTVINKESVEKIFVAQLDKIAATLSVINPPDIRGSHDEGFAMILAEAAGIKSVAVAVQRQVGYDPDELNFNLYSQGGKLNGVVSGRSRITGDFSQSFTLTADEALDHFIQRAANWGAAQIAPYTTALFLLQSHGGDGDFRDVVTLCDHTIAALPPSPLNPMRSEFENLLGLVDMFRNDPKAARGHFETAVAAWPEGPVPVLNLAFAELELDHYATAADHVRDLLARAPKTHPAVIGSAYLTLGAALMGQRNYDAAEVPLATAVQANPDSSAAPDLWAELKDERGDHAGAARLRQIAEQNSEKFENFGELAVLYFRLSWHDNEPVTRSKFSNPGDLVMH